MADDQQLWGYPEGRRPPGHQRPSSPQPQEPGQSARARRHQRAGPAAMEARHFQGWQPVGRGFRSDLHGTGFVHCPLPSNPVALGHVPCSGVMAGS